MGVVDSLATLNFLFHAIECLNMLTIASCRLRHAMESAVPWPGQSASQRRTTEWTSNSVP